MISPYDKALSRLKARRSANPEYDLASRQLFTMSNALNKEQQSVNARIGYTGNTVSAQVGAMLKNNASIGEVYNKVFTQADANREQRVNALDNQIENVQQQKDAADEAKRQQEKEQKQGMWKAGIQMGMTAIGAIAGSVIPGAGTMIGMKIGSSLGSLLAGSGAIGAHGGVTGAADPNLIVQGVEGIATTAIDMQTTAHNKEVVSNINKVMMGTMDTTSPTPASQMTSDEMLQHYDANATLTKQDASIQMAQQKWQSWNNPQKDYVRSQMKSGQYELVMDALGIPYKRTYGGN